MKTIKLVILVFFVSNLLFSSCSKDETGTPSYSAIELEILKLVNEHRTTIKKSTLELNDIVSQEAKTHTSNMANGSVAFGHDGFSERISRIKAALAGNGAGGENVASGYTSAKAVMDGWLNSAGHKANIEGDYNLIGIAAVQDKSGGYYYTQIFYKK